MVWEKANLLSSPNVSLEEKYWVIEWLLFYNKFIASEKYKYLMKRVTAHLIFYPRTKENSWIVD